MKGKISVLLPVYNGERTLKRCFNSLLDQTYSDWEVVFCDDHSTDKTPEILKALQTQYPEKVKIVTLEKNLGCCGAMEKGLPYCEGEFLARQDADDLSLPDRFAKQVDFLKEHPEFAFVSGGIDHFDEKGIWASLKGKTLPNLVDIFHGAPYCSGATLFRKNVYEAVGGYSWGKKYYRIEDTHIWYKLYKKNYQGYNLEDAIYLYEDDRRAYSRRNFKNRLSEVRYRYWVWKEQKFPKWWLIYLCRPIIVGLLPLPVYDFLHRRRVARGMGE